MSSHADLRNGLVGWWKFDESSGNAVDSSSYSNTGTPTGTTIVSNCQRGGCRSFNGSGDFVDLGTGSSLNPTEVSVSSWIKASSFSNAYNTVVQRGNGTDYYEFFVKSNGKAAMYVAAVGLTSFYDGTGSATLAVNRWYHLVLTYSVANGLKGYVNGVLDGSATANGALISVAANAYIGKDGFTAGRLFAGHIDDVRIYNRALIAQEVKDLYQLGIVIRNGVVRNGRINQ